ncbi:MAG: SO_0444 family Cu/Zn efflux transporter [Planctomycetes bacterium]|nr:SO_0444 family Cu/Zn efflux transporter [Planctomycetota bacterium]
MYDIPAKLVTESWLVLGQMAPYLLLGFLVAGVLSVCISPAWVERHLGRRGLRPVVAASLLGVPLPLCSCGVIPVSASIRRHGASRSATTAFLLSTPQTGVDSIAVTYALLGPVFALFRPLAALLTGILGGTLVEWFTEADEADPPEGPAASTCTESCCDGDRRQNVVLQALRYGFVTLPRDIGAALLVGILIAAAIAAAVPEGQLHAYLGTGIVSILCLMALGVPVYVCATASVPIAAGFMHAGASPGSALAFLIAGPATNAATLTTVWRVMGRRTTFLYVLTVATSAVVGGLTLDWLVPAAQVIVPALGEHHHQVIEGGWLEPGSAVVLLIVLAWSYAASGHKKEEPMANDDKTAGGPDAQQRVALRVQGMTCSHCADTVRRTLAEREGVSSVDVDLKRGSAIIVGNRLDGRQLQAAVTELGYQATQGEQ